MAGGLSSALIKIVERIVPKRWMRRYEVFMYSSGINFLAAEYLIVSLLIGIIGGLVAELFLHPVYAVATFVALFAAMAFGYPYWKITKRIEDMEKMLPDAFFYLASSLRAGISFSEALEELTTTKFGALTEEFRRTVAEIKKGRPTSEALRAFAIRNMKSPVIYRSMMIIIEALERGAPMSDVLVYVGNDVREILRIKQERKASTGMQVMFFIITSGFIGPLILGIVAQVMFAMSTGNVTFPVGTIRTILLAFVALQAIVSGLGIGVIREGKYSAGIKYSLLLMVMGIVVFQGTSGLNIGI
ncbi:type II secretion system F family protein [Thermococcus thioreducens]|uniref:Flp pilus assembly protein TadB n=1 Tax=Thermococcus thioreducens TaxID=277988 RepID=A0A0Q2MUN5_9EURY|nr:type II secretion system F family protein [Thermococcus thioreducens]ASJ11420.1 type II secretion protein F [Thermococcus thioreducens]KQH83439.1 type II secretion protein F [Thermococcus thioreducens]SEW07051.1 Flp pilus assembly protein TadB [Thermococcus thioreducens]